MMIRLSALKDIPKPWFKDTLGNSQQHQTTINDIPIDVVAEQGTDDLYFCQKVTDAGYDIIAHGGVLPIHIDIETGQQYHLPEDSYPVKSYLEKKAAYEKAGKTDATNLKARKVSVPEVKI
jgi:hypothetical protein